MANPKADSPAKTTEQLAELMKEFRLLEAEYEVNGFRVAFKKNGPVKTVMVSADGSASAASSEPEMIAEPEAAPAGPKGTPISSPMTGIYYSSASPGAPAFVKEGDSVTAGQVVGLIEAMKVFNEITSPVSGMVTKLTAENGAVVNPGDPLLYVG